MENPRILIPAFISGCCAMVVEIAGSRAMAPYLGSTIYTWSAVIGLVLGALSLGYFLGGRLAEKYSGDRNKFSLIFLFAAFTTLAVPFMIAVVAPLSLFLELSIASILASIVLVPASIFYGMVGPYAVKIISKSDDAGRSSGEVFSLSTIGSIIGSIGTGFILVPVMELSHIFILAGLLMFICAIIVSGRKRWLDLFVFCLVAIPVSAIGFHFPIDGQMIHYESSEYFEIAIYNTTINEQESLLLLLDNAPSSAITLNGDYPFPYLSTSRLGYNLTDEPKSALVLGVAGGTQVEDLKSHYPGIHVDGVEIDSRVVEIGMEYFGLNDDNTTIHIDDARRFLNRNEEEYDLVIMDTFKGNSIPYHLSSREFFLELEEDMSDDSVLIINLIAIPDSRLSSLMHNTLLSVFENVFFIPLEDNPNDRQNIVIIATDNDANSFAMEHDDLFYEPGPIGGELVLDELNSVDILVPPREYGK